MNVQDKMEQKLKVTFLPQHLEIINDSKKHAGHAVHGRETHFTVKITSEKFLGLSRVQRHRLIHECLQEELKKPVHALVIEANAP